MRTIEAFQKPTKSEQRAAVQSYNALAETLKQISNEETEIEIEETKVKLQLPLRALKLLNEILKAMSQGKPISIVPMATEVTTQKASEILGCSRPFLVKLLEDGAISFTKVGKHRRVKFEDVLKYKERMKQEQKQHIIDIMKFDEEKGLYDS